MSCWIHAETAVNQSKVEVVEAMTGNHEKDECRVALDGEERDFWMGTEAGMLGGYNFQGMVQGDDGADDKGKMGAGPTRACAFLFSAYTFSTRNSLATKLQKRKTWCIFATTSQY